MKRKGFTLIELLAVIVILSVITLITVPMITSVIEESKKKALISSVQGLIESANLYAIENEGVYEFLFDKEHQGSTQKGESLDYKGKIEGEGKLYIDKEGNTSICISNDTYYVYKNYNSGIIIGERSKDNCNIEYDALTNKYVAFLESTGSGSNVYSKDEVNNLVDSLDTKITNNTSEISNIKNNIEELQTNLNNYALQSDLEEVTNNFNNFSSIISSHDNSINDLKTITSDLQAKLKGNFYVIDVPMNVNAAYITNDMIISALKKIPSQTSVYVINFYCPGNANAAIIGYNLGLNYGVGLYFNYYLNNRVYKFINSNYTLTLIGL